MQPVCDAVVAIAPPRHPGLFLMPKKS
jgi:hypothetical protein